MTLRGEFRSFLTADTAINAIISGRAYWLRRPLNETSETCIVFSRVEKQELHEINGHTGYSEATWRIECRGTSDSVVEALEEAVIDALDGYSGPLGANHIIEFSLNQDAADFVEFLPDGRATEVIGIALFFFMRIEETEG